MRAFFSAPRKINLGCSVNRCSSSPTVLKNVLNKNSEIKHIKQNLTVKDFCDNHARSCFQKNITSGSKELYFNAP